MSEPDRRTVLLTGAAAAVFPWQVSPEPNQPSMQRNPSREELAYAYGIHPDWLDYFDNTGKIS